MEGHQAKIVSVIFYFSFQRIVIVLVKLKGSCILRLHKVNLNNGRYLIYFCLYCNPPSSPHTSFLAMQGISTYPNSVSLDICWAVMGCCHIAVFIAGQKRRGRLVSHALTTHVCQWQRLINSEKILEKLCNELLFAITFCRESDNNFMFSPADCHKCH